MKHALRVVLSLALPLTACKKEGEDAQPPDGGKAAPVAAVDDDADDTPQLELPERPFDYHLAELDNGLKIVTLEDHSAPIAAVQLWYHVGSKDERPNRRGFAHMFEHMMFRGTENIGPKAHFEYIRKVGGWTNAYTSFDNTTYIQTVPSNQVEMVMWLEAERMAFLKINDGYFDTERNVVAEEYRLGREQPYGTAAEKLLSQVFTKHPYRWSPIGDMDELRAASADELQAFWETYYVPNNATLVVAGDVDHEEVEKMAEQYFGFIPRYPEPPRVTVKEPVQTEAKKITIKERNGPVPVVALGYRTVPMGHPDELELEMLGTILGGGESSRLYRDLVTDRELAMVALSAGFALEDDGLFGAAAVLSPFGSDQDDVIAAIREHLVRIREEGVTDDELRKAKTTMLRNSVFGQTTVGAKAQRIGEAIVLQEDIDSVNREFAEIRDMTTEDLQRAAKEYIRDEREIEVRIKPNMLGFIVDQITKDEPKKDDGDKSEGTEEITGAGSGKPGLKRPASLGPAPRVAPPTPPDVSIDKVTHVLDNGLPVVVVQNDEVPMVSYTLGLDYGAWADPADAPGLASVAVPMLTRGTQEHDYKTLTDELDERAISIGGGVGMDALTVRASALANEADRAMELMAEAVRYPTFPDKELTQYVKQTRTGLAIAERTPAWLADRELRKRMFGAHPYARLPDAEAKDLEAITAEKLRAWWSTHARPDAAVLYVTGDIDPTDAFEMAQDYFGDWDAEGTRPTASIPAAKKAGKTTIYLVDRAGYQSQIRVGHPGITRQHPDYVTTRVLSDVFGGGFNSRLNDTIRVKKGLTYGAGGGFSASRFAGRFTVSTFSKNSTVGETVQTILDEIERLENEPPTQREVEDSVSYLLGTFAVNRETPQAVVNALWDLHYQGLPADYYERYVAALPKVESGDITKAASKLIDPDHLVIVVVGPAKVLKNQLAPIADVIVVDPNKTD